MDQIAQEEIEDHEKIKMTIIMMIIIMMTVMVIRLL